MNKLILNSYAKLNLYLEVLNRRKDNLHNIKTLFERIDLSDRIILKTQPDKLINIKCSTAGMPTDTSNLAYRSAKLLQDSFKVNQGVQIKIIKRIPVGSGLGGGSSNAACVLRGLNKLWRLNLSPKRLVALAKKIGSDVPFFVYDCPYALGLSRGDRIIPLEALNKLKLWHILIVPKIEVLTPFIYQNWDAYTKNARLNLTKPRYDVKILNLGLKKFNLPLIGRALHNSLEAVTTRLYPEVRHIKARLKHLGLKAILMSGSGPAVFGMVSSRKEAQELCRQLKAENSNWQVFVTRTV